MTSKSTTLMVSLIRCGETTWAPQRRLYGSTDLPLSNAGRAMVAESCAGIAKRAVAAVYHPADDAATATAKAFAAAFGTKTKSVADLADPALGLLEGITEDEFAERYAKRQKQWIEDPLSFSPPEGEDFATARARLFGAIASILKRTRGGEVGIVLHSIGLGLLRCWLADRPANELWRMLESKARVERYAFDSAMIDSLAAVPDGAVAADG